MWRIKNFIIFGTLAFVATILLYAFFFVVFLLAWDGKSFSIVLSSAINAGIGSGIGCGMLALLFYPPLEEIIDAVDDHIGLPVWIMKMVFPKRCIRQPQKRIEMNLSNLAEIRVKRYPMGWSPEIKKKTWYGRSKWVHLVPYVGIQSIPFYYKTLDSAVENTAKLFSKDLYSGTKIEE